MSEMSNTDNIGSRIPSSMVNIARVEKYFYEVKEMEETVIIDGRQYNLISEQPLTMEQKIQTIADIRRQSGYGYDNEMTDLGEINTLLDGVDCFAITAIQQATITIQSIFIDGATPQDCTLGGCTVIVSPTHGVSVIVTFANSGDVNGSITPTLTVYKVPAPPGPIITPIIPPAQPTPITVPKSADFGTTPGTVTVTFQGVLLPRGSDSICINW